MAGTFSGDIPGSVPWSGRWERKPLLCQGSTSWSGAHAFSDMTHKRAPRSKVKGWATETFWEGCCERRKQDRGEDTTGCVTSRVKSKVTQKPWIPYSMAQKNRRHWVENNL